TGLRQQVALGATSAPSAAAVPAKLNRTGQIETWTDGRRIELRTWSEHARAKLALVTTEIAAFRTSQLARLNKPDRSGSAAADTPVKHVVDGVKALIRLIELIIRRPILR